MRGRRSFDSLDLLRGTLGEALDNPTLTWTTGGSANWYPQTESLGDSEAVSGPITHNQRSWIQTTVTCPGTLRYLWRVSSELNWDFLSFYLNDALQAGRISGMVHWTIREHSLPAGAHTLRWEYAKDGLVSVGLEAV